MVLSAKIRIFGLSLINFDKKILIFEKIVNMKKNRLYVLNNLAEVFWRKNKDFKSAIFDVRSLYMGHIIWPIMPSKVFTVSKSVFSGLSDFFARGLIGTQL